MNDAVIAKFDAFKLKKAGDVKIITLKIESSEVVIDAEYPKSKSWDDFMKDDLKDDAPRYVLLDFDYKTKDGRDADKIILVSWRARRARDARAPRRKRARRAPRGAPPPRPPPGRAPPRAAAPRRSRPRPRRIPDTCKIKLKMTYSGTKEAVKSALQGIAINLNATDHSECTSDEILAACTKI